MVIRKRGHEMTSTATRFQTLVLSISMTFPSHCVTKTIFLSNLGAKSGRKLARFSKQWPVGRAGRRDAGTAAKAGQWLDRG